jgi:nucleotide-binding universal stress UspA family protein
VFQRILLPFDLTEKNAPALEVAASLIDRTNGSITILHVIELLDAPMEELEDFYHELEESSRSKMEKAAQPLRDAGLTVELQVRYGKRVPEIVKFADESPADLVVISSHRIDPTDPSRTWMTISHQLAMLIAKPVLIVK